MAYSQALQAWAAGVEPKCSMNPILLKPKGDGSSEVIHLGKSVGVTRAENYYQDWFLPGWHVIREALTELRASHKDARFVLEGAGSPVEVNLQRRDLTNLRLAQFLKANCILVADIERGGVFAQLVGTLSLLRPVERALIKGLLINKFRGSIELFEDGRTWLEDKTGIPVLGVMPWLNDLYPPEDSLDLLERKTVKPSAEIEIAVIKLPHISNFSDIDPLESEPSIQLKWITSGDSIGDPDCVIIPGSKQTVKDLKALKKYGLAEQLKGYVNKGGHVFGICGGMQILGRTLIDPENIENTDAHNFSEKHKGLDLLPIKTVFQSKKILTKRKVVINWPETMEISGFEIHHGESTNIEDEFSNTTQISKEKEIGWVKGFGNDVVVVGTYLHGIFENGRWRRTWINWMRDKKQLTKLDVNHLDFNIYRNQLIDNLADSFEEHIDLSALNL